MSRNKAGTKTGRAEKNRTFQQALRERKRLRRKRREEKHFGKIENLPTVYFTDNATPVIKKAVEQIDSMAEQQAIVLGMPSPGEWDEIVATAKKRKRGIKTFAEKAGFVLVGKDPKERESWKVDA